MKRKHGLEKFPHILEAIESGQYTVREPDDKKKYSQAVTWALFRLIFDENSVQIADHFFCIRCHVIFNLSLSKSGQCLKRHAEKCEVPVNTSSMHDFFVPELHHTKRLKITQEDRSMIRDAAIAYIVKDMRPIISINGEGMGSLLSKMTYVGAKYGHISEEAMPRTNLIPSRQPVRISLRIRTRFQF